MGGQRRRADSGGLPVVGTERSGFAGNVTVKAPFASVFAVPRAIRWASPPKGSHGKKQRHQMGQRTRRSTRHFTVASVTGRPV